MPTVEVDGARLWYDGSGDGPAVLLLHGGLGDSGLWEPVVPFLAERFRTIRTDLRFYGRSTGPAVPWSWEDDVVGVLDALGIERAALVGLSFGGKLALDVALSHPERVWAVAGVAPGLGGHEAGAYSEEQDARYEVADAAGDLEAAMEIDLEVWAPLGADERIRRLWHATPEASSLPDGLEPISADGPPAKERLGELSVPALVVTVSHDPAGMREIGPLVAREAPGARHVELDSDHYVTLREPELLSGVLLEFLAAAAPQQ
ncbi:MAG TPA: alpha/beta hydrolase [Gaiellaceae bacterium]|nr:alpha/beta hydrolase [Gaiellaceae bacterium]